VLTGDPLFLHIELLHISSFFAPAFLAYDLTDIGVKNEIDGRIVGGDR
jgi:hypothetical protein